MRPTATTTPPATATTTLAFALRAPDSGRVIRVAARKSASAGENPAIPVPCHLSGPSTMNPRSGPGLTDRKRILEWPPRLVARSLANVGAARPQLHIKPEVKRPRQDWG